MLHVVLACKGLHVGGDVAALARDQAIGVQDPEVVGGLLKSEALQGTWQLPVEGTRQSQRKGCARVPKLAQRAILALHARGTAQLPAS